MSMHVSSRFYPSDESLRAPRLTEEETLSCPFSFLFPDKRADLTLLKLQLPLTALVFLSETHSKLLIDS